MTEMTDDDHRITMPEIQKALEAYEVTADRKSLYDDLEALRVLGIDVIGEKEGRGYYYHVGGKEFEIAELKLLVDAIQSSKFITERKSNELIGKLTGMASRYEASQLKRQVVVKGRVKTMNESIYYFVDDVHRAIADDRKIRFDYMKWNTKKEMENRRDRPYIVSPWALTWDDDNYYLIAYDEEAEDIRHFRVDKMKSIEVLDEHRTGKESFNRFDLARYTNMSFGMFGGDITRVRIEFIEDYAGVMLDRFGTDIIIAPAKRNGWYSTSVEVALSDQFFGWIFALGANVKITGPDAVVKKFTEEIRSLNDMYAH